MRLTEYEAASIKKAFAQSFEEGKIYLFGSRVDDAKRGGDIDLYLCPAKKYKNAMERRRDFLIKLTNGAIDASIVPMIDVTTATCDFAIRLR